MNRYGLMALEHNRRHRPAAFAQIQDPETFFARAGEEIADEVSRVRDEILGPPRRGEAPETHRRRSSQASATAEELVLADHFLFQPEATGTEEDWTDDPEMAGRYRALAEINQAINLPL